MLQKASLKPIVSASNAEGPPVPIPNTEVKLCSAEHTCLETSREDSSLLTHNTANRKASGKLVILTQRVHPFPFRTRKLSSAEPKILAWRRAGTIGHGRHHRDTSRIPNSIFLLSSVGRANNALYTQELKRKTLK